MANKKDVINSYKEGYNQALQSCLNSFNWRYNAFLKNQYTPRQFSTGFRKAIKSLKHDLTV